MLQKYIKDKDRLYQYLYDKKIMISDARISDLNSQINSIEIWRIREAYVIQDFFRSKEDNGSKKDKKEEIIDFIFSIYPYYVENYSFLKRKLYGRNREDIKKEFDRFGIFDLFDIPPFFLIEFCSYLKLYNIEDALKSIKRLQERVKNN